MGRRKREVKRIEDKIARQVTFSKRRNGLLKKANELSVLCDVEVAAMIFCDRGKLYDYCSSSSLPEMLRRYHSSVEAEPSSSTGVLQNQDQCSKYEGFLTSGELLQIVERDLEEPFIDQLSVNDLQHLENQVVEALIQTRSTKTCLLLDSVSSLKEKEKSSEEANRLLKEKISGNKRPQVGQQTKVVIDLNVLADDQATEGEQILKY